MIKYVLICLIVSFSMPTQGMCGRFSSYVATKFASNAAAINRFSARSAVNMSHFKNKFTTQARMPIVSSRTNFFSCVYGGCMFVSIAQWFQTIKQKQEKEFAIEQKVIVPHELVSSIFAVLPQKNTHVAPWLDACKKHYQELQAKPWSEVSKKYIDILKQRENELENELLSRFGLTAQAWQKFKNDCQHEFSARVQKEVSEFNTQANSQNFDARIMSAAKHACQHIGVVYDNITLVSIPSDIPSNMYAKQHYLMINQKLCLKFYVNDQIREMGIARELQHILHDDTFDKYCIEKIHKLNDDKVNQEAYQALAKKVSHFKEERADVMITLADPTYGQIGKSTFKDLSNPPWWLQKIAKACGKDLKDLSPATHPTSLYRYECVNKVHQEVIAALESSKGR